MAQAKTIFLFLARFDPLAIDLVNRPSIIGVKQIEEPALLQGLAENFIEGTRDERGKARVRSEQTLMVIEFENQIRRIRSKRSPAELGIAQIDGLIGRRLSKSVEFVDELRSVFLLVAPQQVTSRWKTSQSAPT